jgi:hypothetical protein
VRWQGVRWSGVRAVGSKDGLLTCLRLHGPNSLAAEVAGDGPAEGADGRVDPGMAGQTVDLPLL